MKQGDKLGGYFKVQGEAWHGGDGEKKMDSGVILKIELTGLPAYWRERLLKWEEGNLIYEAGTVVKSPVGEYYLIIPCSAVVGPFSR